MRLFEFAGDDNLDKFIVVLKNFIGRYSSKKAPAKLNWSALDRITQSSGIETMADYETFKAMYDSSPQLQTLVKNFNADGIELNVPGAPDADKEPTQDSETSAEKIDKIASAAAPKQLAANQAGIQA
jgi:hypothetical protein